MARNGPPDDFNDQPTQYANYGVRGRPPASGPPGKPPPTVPPPEAPPEAPPHDEQPESLDPLDQETEPTPWYRKPVVLIGWVVAVLILIALIVYGIIELIQGGQSTSHLPSTTSTTPTTTTTTAPTPTTTEPSTTPPSSSAVEPPRQQPTYQPTPQPTQQQPTHRHHLPSLPSVITIPGVPTVITLPPGLP